MDRRTFLHWGAYSLGAGVALIAGCGGTEKEVQVVHIYHYPDAGERGSGNPGELPPGSGFSEGEGQGGGGGGEGPSEHPDASHDSRFDAGSGRDRDAGVSGSGADAGSGAGDGAPPRIEYDRIEQFFGQRREASATIYDASPVDVDFILTNARGLEEKVTVRYEQVAQRGREAELGGTSGIYRANFGNVWDQPGRYWLTIIASARTEDGRDEASSDHDILVLDELVLTMERNLRDAAVYSLDYNDWKAKIVEGDLFREMFNRQNQNHPGKTDADAVFNYEHLLGRRVAGGREYQKVPIQVHLLRSGDERGALVPVYEFLNEEGGWHVNFAGLVYEDLGVRATGERIEQALRNN